MRNRSSPRAAAAALFAGFLFAAAHASGQGMVATDDGLELSLSASGAIPGLRLKGIEYATSSISSGFAYRELPAAPADVAPNGSFESGSGAPDSWSWTNTSAGTWSWDGSVAAAGARSLRLDLPGSTSRRSPMLNSSSFPIRPNTPYMFSGRMRTAGISSSLDLYVIEEDAAGHAVQRGVRSGSGTNDWQTRGLTFTSSPTAVAAYFKVEIYNGYGTAWIDDVKMLDVFAGRAPLPFPATVTTAQGLTQTGSADGLSLTARFTPIGAAIRVDATLSDATARDRGVELSFRLPLDLPGWSWEQNPVTALTVADGVRYENLDASFGAQSHSVYPFATVRNDVAAISLATPMVPQMNRFSYDRQTGFRLTWDLGLSAAAVKTRSQGTVTFWIFTQEPRWGFRAAAEKYALLNPESFLSSVDPAAGAWVLGTPVPLASVPRFADFGWAFIEGIDQMDFANANALAVLHYVDPSGWFRSFPGYSEQPPYDVLVSTLHGDATSSSGTTVDATPLSEMAAAVINSSPYDEGGRYQVFADSYFWYGNRLQIYPVSPDADIPAPSMWSVLTKYSIDQQREWAAESGNRLDGIFLDDVSSTFATVENYRKELWAYSDLPLTFSWGTGKPTLYDGFSIAEFCASIGDYVHRRGLTLMGSMNPGVYAWFAPHFDVLGGEAPGADSIERSYVRRVLGAGRPWSNLFVTSGGVPPAEADVRAYLRQALLLGYFPGFSGAYWKDPASYERDRPLFRQYIPLIRTIAQAGWRPVSGATPSDSSIYVERFDDGRGAVFYLTAQNSGSSARTFQLVLDGSTLGIQNGEVQVQELLGNKTISVSRAGALVSFSDTGAAGETLVYRVTAPRRTPPERGQARVVVRN